MDNEFVWNTGRKDRFVRAFVEFQIVLFCVILAMLMLHSHASEQMKTCRNLAGQLRARAITKEETISKLGEPLSRTPIFGLFEIWAFKNPLDSRNPFVVATTAEAGTISAIKCPTWEQVREYRR